MSAPREAPVGGAAEEPPRDPGGDPADHPAGRPQGEGAGDGPETGLVVEVQRAVAGPALHPPLSDERLRAWALAALAGRRRRAELTLRLVDEPEMVRLNAAFRGRQGPTNVLAFPFEPGLPPGVPMDPPLLGDVVLCLPVALREARALGRAPHFHLAHLVVHGVLHLLGHDHHEEAEARRMEAAEAQVLQGLGFPHPYGGGAEEQAGEEAGAGRPAGRGGEARGGSA